MLHATHRFARTLAGTLLVVGLSPAATAQAPTPIHHELRVELSPAEHALLASDRISNALRSEGPVTFRLHAGLTVTSVDADLELTTDDSEELAGSGSGESGPALAVRTWRVARKDGAPLDPERVLQLEYSGIIHSEVQSIGGEYSKSFSTTPGIIGGDGVVLGGASWWVPSFEAELVTFSLTIDLPADWDAVSQGDRSEHGLVDTADGQRQRVTWSCGNPMQEIYIIAARFHEYSTVSGNVTAYAFLREDDGALANKYLGVTAQYIEMYRQLIGPYPFSKFALVENFWETGYGMPSFTLLGPSVIRLPFILHSSYPHEILHNWWGNGVYVDYESGNWCEGLTAYLADHLIKEGRGSGHDYRRDSLDSYRNYVSDAKDFALSEFRSRHSAATQAVGYGKSLMLWHMLRKRIGDEAFVGGLQRFYRRFRFKEASFEDMQKVFTESAGVDLSEFFAQWVERTGAPVLEMQVHANTGGVEIELTQTQSEDTYDLLIPIAVTRAGSSEASLQMVSMNTRNERVTLAGDGIERIDVDPHFDLFRRLHREEIPPTMSGVFGAERTALVVPSSDEDPLADGWLTLANGWQAGQDSVEVLTSDAIDELPQDRCVWILGSGNRWRTEIADALARRGVAGPPTGDDCFVYALRHPADPDLTVGWVGTANGAALPGLERKLPHYGKYSFLEFTGDEPTNSAKGQWQATASPLVWTSSGGAVERGALPEAEPLASLAPTFDPRALHAHVEALCAPEFEGRGVGTEGILLAERYIQDAFAEAGLQPGGEGDSYLQEWAELGGPDGTPVRMANVIGVLPGNNPDMAGQSVVISAHYDHLGHGWPDVRSGNEGQLHPGADDNASGVAVLIELARDLARSHLPGRTMIFVAFSGEEWGLKGSRHYLQAMQRWPAKDVFAMVNMDTVGRLDGKPITVFGSGSATEWVHIARGIGFTTGIKSTCIADDPGGSDQVSFHHQGIPAVQIFGSAHGDYHRPSDTVDQVDAGGLVRVASFMKEMTLYLSDRPDPMTSTLASSNTTDAASRKPPAPSTSSRRVSLGTVPDFEFTGPGVQVSSVVPDSAAADAKLVAGDILLAIDQDEISDLRSYSQLLKAHAPGDEVTLRIRRDGVEIQVPATLRAR
ncbi:MAG: aminopeptidase N [Planctomycetota bacterium]|jgi:aminopeptidase N